MAKMSGTILAAAVGALFASSTFAAGTSSTSTNGDLTVKCTGINACKGTSACKSSVNACKGQNSCKGKGLVMVASEKDCADKGGKVETTDASKSN